MNCDHPGVSKPKVVEFGEKRACASRRVLHDGIQILDLWSTFDLVMTVKGHIFAKSAIFQLRKPMIGKLCSEVTWNLHQRVPRAFQLQMTCLPSLA